MNPFDKSWTKEEDGDPPIPERVGHADITIIFDRSGSMHGMKHAVVEGFNSYVARMRETPGDSKWTLVQFDEPDSARGAGEQFPNVVFCEKGEKEVPILTADDYQPRGGTALIDAMCKTIENTKLRTSGQDDYTKVIMMVVTDGEENSSREHNSSRMRELIAETQKKGWQYLYFAANVDAFHETSKYGIGTSYNANQMGQCSTLSGGLGSDARMANNYVPTAAGMQQAMGSGFAGIAASVSGAVQNGRIVQPDMLVTP